MDTVSWIDNAQVIYNLENEGNHHCVYVTQLFPGMPEYNSIFIIAGRLDEKNTRW